MTEAADRHPIALLVCSVFAAEVESLRKTHWPELSVRVESSMLHVCPGRLGGRLEADVVRELRQGRKVLLVYGDCYNGMAALVATPGVARVRGANCADLLLGRERYRRLLDEGAYFLLPEWARRGARFFEHELGLNRENATGLMRDLHQKIIYLDTGMTPVPERELQQVADYCGLPWETLPVALDFLQAAIADALRRLADDPVPPS